MFAMGYIEMGESRKEAAARNYNRSFANVHPPFAVWTENPDGGSNNFLTGAGGFLQAALFGYTQLRIDDNRMTLKPSLPELTNVVKLRGFSYLGNVIDLKYDTASISFEARSAATMTASGIEHALEVADSATGKSYKLRAGEMVELPYTQGVSTFIITAFESPIRVDDDNGNNEKKSEWESLTVTDKALIIASSIITVLTFLYFAKKKYVNGKLGQSAIDHKRAPLIRPQDTMYSIVEQGDINE